MKGEFNPKSKGYEMPQQVCDMLGNELKVGMPVYLKEYKLLAEIGHIIQPTVLPGDGPSVPGEMVLVVRWQLPPKDKTYLDGLIAVQVPPATAVQVAETPKPQPVAVGANEEGG